MGGRARGGGGVGGGVQWVRGRKKRGTGGLLDAQEGRKVGGR